MEKIKEEEILKFISGSGSGSGDGSGYGYGYGYGSGDGSGSGSGDGSFRLKKFKKSKVYYVDTIPTVFHSIKGNCAQVSIIDLSTMTSKRCWLVKSENYIFAHGDDLHKAQESLQKKIFSKMNIDEKIKEFCKLFNKDCKYKGNDFYAWHHHLTGSCDTGRSHFINEKHLSLDTDYSVNEFINICQNAYGGETIKRLKEFYK